jgi:hypothetical protein
MVLSSSAISLLQGPASASCGVIVNTTAAAARNNARDARIERPPLCTILEDGGACESCVIGQSANWLMDLASALIAAPKFLDR